MKTALLILSLVASPIPLAAEEIPQQYIPALEKAYTALSHAIKNLETQITTAEKTLTQFDPTIPNNERSVLGKDRREKIAALKKKLQTLKDSDQLTLTPVSLPDVGDVGFLFAENPIIEKIEDNPTKALIIRFTYNRQEIYSNDGAAITKDNLGTRTRMLNARVRILMPIPPDARIGDHVDLPQAVRVKTAGQPSTVEPVNWQAIADYSKQFIAQKEATEKKLSSTK